MDLHGQQAQPRTDERLDHRLNLRRADLLDRAGQHGVSRHSPNRTPKNLALTSPAQCLQRHRLPPNHGASRHLRNLPALPNLAPPLRQALATCALVARALGHAAQYFRRGIWTLLTGVLSDAGSLSGRACEYELGSGYLWGCGAVEFAVLLCVGEEGLSGASCAC